MHPLSIFSAEIEAWVQKLFYDRYEQLLKRRQIDRVLLYLAGRAEDQKQVNIELCDAIEAEPLLRYVIRLVKHEQHVKRTPTDLLQQLNQLAATQPFVLTSHRWPKDPISLGRRLRQLSEWITKAGIDIDLKQRESSHRWIILKDSPDSSGGEPSSHPSSDKSAASNDLGLRDRNDDENRIIREQQFEALMKGLSK